MRAALAIGCCFVVAGGCSSNGSNQPAEWTFHTTPDKWSEPRIFQTPGEEDWSHIVSLERNTGQAAAAERVYAPNKAYWFSVSDADAPAGRHCAGSVTIYTERQYLLEMKIAPMRCHFQPDARWINEKLVYVRAWLGRVLAVDLIVDVEEERILYKEMSHWGQIAFQQWKQAAAGRPLAKTPAMTDFLIREG
ncbi:MAG: hypothetical protein JSU94_12370 [Phycisphaerales bacterium]|nr:MAG: hypothetical protein JSU94_12370 [Phycisphaerales bacterium]